MTLSREPRASADEANTVPVQRLLASNSMFPFTATKFMSAVDSPPGTRLDPSVRTMMFPSSQCASTAPSMQCPRIRPLRFLATIVPQCFTTASSQQVVERRRSPIVIAACMILPLVVWRSYSLKA